MKAWKKPELSYLGVGETNYGGTSLTADGGVTRDPETGETLLETTS